MAHLTPVRDATGSIIGMQPQGSDESQFAATLADTMAAVGVSDPTAPTVAPPAASPHLAMIALGLVGALILVAALNLLRGVPPVPEQLPVVPTSAPVTVTHTPVSTATALPPTPTPEPPTPVVIIQQAPPVQCYSVTLDVTDARGIPIGVATGESCESQEAAQANAEALAADVRADHERK